MEKPVSFSRMKRLDASIALVPELAQRQALTPRLMKEPPSTSRYPAGGALKPNQSIPLPCSPHSPPGGLQGDPRVPGADARIGFDEAVQDVPVRIGGKMPTLRTNSAHRVGPWRGGAPESLAPRVETPILGAIHRGSGRARTARARANARGARCARIPEVLGHPPLGTDLHRRVGVESIGDGSRRWDGTKPQGHDVEADVGLAVADRSAAAPDDQGLGGVGEARDRELDRAGIRDGERQLPIAVRRVGPGLPQAEARGLDAHPGGLFQLGLRQVARVDARRGQPRPCRGRASCRGLRSAGGDQQSHGGKRPETPEVQPPATRRGTCAGHFHLTVVSQGPLWSWTGGV